MEFFVIFPVLKNPGICWDVDAKIFTSAQLVFVVRYYSDKAFFYATCDSDEHCSIDATVTLLYVE